MGQEDRTPSEIEHLIVRVVEYFKLEAGREFHTVRERQLYPRQPCLTLKILFDCEGEVGWGIRPSG